MTNNDILRRLRYVFDYSDSQMIALFAKGGQEVSRAQVSDWLKREDNPESQPCNDLLLATFLNGLIIAKRGSRGGPPPEPERALSNNSILVKIKIALAMRTEDLTETLALAGHPVSKHELSAFFRKPEHRQYRPCQDQILRKFLQGLQLQHRGAPDPKSDDQA